jgi:hypothetical protein
LELRPGGKCRFAATFDKTAAGVKFGNVESSSDQIVVPAEIDLAAVDIDFERLANSADSEGAAEAEEFWESIRRLVNCGPPTTRVPGHTSPLDIKYDRATISIVTEYDDDLYAAAASIDHESPRVRQIGEKQGNGCVVASKVPSLKRKPSHTSTTHDGLNLRAKSIIGRGIAPLPSNPKYSSSGRSTNSVPNLPVAHAGKKVRTSVQRAALDTQPTKRRRNHINIADESFDSRNQVSRERAATALSSKSKQSRSTSSKLARGYRNKATHRSACQDSFDSTNVANKSGKREWEDGPFGEHNIPQVPVKGRMGMKEESAKAPSPNDCHRAAGIDFRLGVGSWFFHL